MLLILVLKLQVFVSCCVIGSSSEAFSVIPSFCVSCCLQQLCSKKKKKKKATTVVATVAFFAVLQRNKKKRRRKQRQPRCRRLLRCVAPQQGKKKDEGNGNVATIAFFDALQEKQNKKVMTTWLPSPSTQRWGRFRVGGGR